MSKVKRRRGRGEPTEGEAPPDADQRLDAACARVAEQYGLTTREGDVLLLLARGRTAPVIQEKHVLSHNTVKSHVRHVYSKLGAHSQQQLIDLVDPAEG